MSCLHDGRHRLLPLRADAIQPAQVGPQVPRIAPGTASRPWPAPPSTPGVIRHGETGLIYESTEEFAAHSTRLIMDMPFRRRLAENAYRYVAENRLLARHFRHREIWYRAMLERLPELNRELKERVPELF